MFSLQLMKSNAAEENESYDDRYCTTCHGADGRGNYGVQAPRLAGMEDWYLKRQLESYRAGLRGVHPRDIEGVAMQPMAAKLTDESIAEILDWVGSWEYKPSEVTIQGDAMAGREFYSVCATCHGAEGEGNQGFGAPALAGQNDWYLVTQVELQQKNKNYFLLVVPPGLLYTLSPTKLAHRTFSLNENYSFFF